MNFDEDYVRETGTHAARQLWLTGYVYARVTPGDATLYEFMAVRKNGADRFMLASTFGYAYPLPICRVDPGYVGAKWLAPTYRNDHTEAVYAVFINSLIDELRELEANGFNVQIEEVQS